MRTDLCGPIKAECLTILVGSCAYGEGEWISRPTPVVVWLRTGRIRTTFDTAPPITVVRDAGDVIWYPPNVRRRAEADSDSGGDFVAAFLSFETASGADPLSFFEIPYRIGNDRGGAEEIRSALDRLVALRLATSENPGDPVRDVLVALERCESVLRILRALLSEARPREHCPSYVDGTRMAPVVAYIRNHFRSSISVSTLANLVHLSRAQFHICFRRATGLSPGAFIQRLRLLEGERLLTHTDLTIAEISERIGIPDPFHLSRLFRKAYGESPSQHRRRHTG